jgi:hypothetical protein
MIYPVRGKLLSHFSDSPLYLSDQPVYVSGVRVVPEFGALLQENSMTGDLSQIGSDEPCAFLTMAF